MTALVVALAVVAALFYALSDFLEQRAASRAAAGAAGSPAPPHESRVHAALRSAAGTFRRMLHDRVWFAGWAVGTLAYFVQAGALHFGAVSTVQALQVTSLLFTLPLSTFHRPQRVRLPDWLGAGAVVAGLALFFLSRSTDSGGGQADRGRMLFLILLLGVSVVVLAAVALVRGGPVRAVLLATAAGASFASSASLVKLTTQELTGPGVLATATDWPGYSLAAAGLVGTVLQQAAFAAGKLPTASTAMIVANPVVGTAFSFVAYGEHLPAGGGLVVMAFGGALIVVGVWVLSHSPLVR